MRRIVVTVAVWVVFCFVLVVHRYLYGGYFWHPLRNGPGYNIWSGILGSFLFSVPGFAVAIAVWWRTHNCHVHGCWRLQWHPHPGHGHPVCVRHHPYGQGRGRHLSEENHRHHSGWPTPIVNPHRQVDEPGGYPPPPKPRHPIAPSRRS